MVAASLGSPYVITNQETTLTLTAYTAGVADDQGTFTIGIVDANGDTVVNSGTAVTDNSDGTYEYTLAAQADPALLTVTWTESAGQPIYTTYLEVIGSSLFNEAQLRGFDDAALASTSDYTAADIAAVHMQVAQFLERETGRSWIRRYCRAAYRGPSGRCIDLTAGEPRTSGGLFLERPGRNRDISRILSANDGASVSTANLSVNGQELTRTDQTWTVATSTNPFNVTIEYEYGVPYPVDGVDRIAMMIARKWLVSSRVPSHAESFTDPLGTYGFGDSSKLPSEAFFWIKNRKVGAFFG